MRFIAGFGGSASMVIPRAVVRDLADGHAAARLMSKLMLVMGAAPILAPTLGGLVLTVGPGERSSGSPRPMARSAACWSRCCCRTRWPTTGGFGSASPGDAAVHIVGRDRVFLAYAAMGGFGMFGMFAYIGGSSPVFIEHFRFTPAQYGMLFGMGAASFIVGSQISPRLLPRFGVNRVVRVAAIVYLLAALVLTLISFLAIGGAWAIVPPVMVAMACMGFVMPNSAVGALSRHAAQAGSASALMGTLQFCLAALSGVLVGLLTDGTARPMAGLMLFGAIAVVIADRLRPAGAGTKRARQLTSTGND